MSLDPSLVLGAIDRLDCAITALGGVMMELDDGPDEEDLSEVQAVRWLYGMLREESHNVRTLVEKLQPQPANGREGPQ